VPVQFKKLDVSLWTGVVADGMSASTGDGTLFSATRVCASHKFGPLLLGRLALGEVRIEKPRFRLVESAAGKWRFSPASTENHPGTTAATRPKSGTPPPSNSRPKSGVSIARIVISDATLEFIDNQKLPVATVTGLNGTIRDATLQGFTGEFEAARVIVHGWAAFEHLKVTATRDDEGLQLRNLKAECGSGGVTGEFTARVGAPTDSRIALDHVNIERAITSGGGVPPAISGFISGEAQVTGIGDEWKAVTANGTAALTDTNCRQIDLARQIAEILQLGTTGNLDHVEAKAVFRIAALQVLLAPMNISAAPLGMSLSGAAGFDGTLALVANLNAPADFIEERGLGVGQFSPPDQDRRRGVQFDIKGTLKKPKHNLTERVTGTKDKTLQKFIAAEAIISALAGKKKDKPKPEEQGTSRPPKPAQP
jgi:hypothetical protein